MSNENVGNWSMGLNRTSSADLCYAAADKLQCYAKATTQLGSDDDASGMDDLLSHQLTSRCVCDSPT
ncbi:hypothetical protein PG985_005460 [Apiospora marii]|uniref:uncharacterized protein n=1 Tax=Apiospora marii TaxID=335849 RepID=UPI00312FA9FA